MSLVFLYLGGAVVDALVHGARFLVRLGALAGLVVVLLLLDGCSPEDWARADHVLAVGVFGLAVGVALVALAVPRLRKRLLALAAALGGLGFLLGFLGLGRRRRGEQRQEVRDARRQAVTGRREQKKADKVEGREVEKIEDSMEKAAGQAELGGSDGDIEKLLELGARRRRERDAGGEPPAGGGA